MIADRRPKRSPRRAALDRVELIHPDLTGMSTSRAVVSRGPEGGYLNDTLSVVGKETVASFLDISGTTGYRPSRN
jgi:hypothetical protein